MPTITAAGDRVLLQAVAALDCGASPEIEVPVDGSGPMEGMSDLSAPSGPPSDETSPSATAARHLIDRKWPVVTFSLLVCTGMAYLLGWGPMVKHISGWTTGGDLWGIFRGAHYVGWGYLGGVYDSSTGVVSFPGIEVLLAPVAMLSGALHLTESFPPFFVARPAAALLVQPIELMLAGTVIFAADALAARLGTGRGRRIALCFVVAGLAWPVAALWGHAEDVVALTFALYALDAVIQGKWARTGWLLGFGIAMQPLVALMVPLLIGASPRGQRLLLALRSGALSALLVGLAFVGNPGGTFRAVVKQPTPPSLNHATPWAALSPTLASGTTVPSTSVHLVERHGHLLVHTSSGFVHLPTVVSGGAGRLIDVAFALLLGLYVWRRPQEGVRLLWLAAAVLASRCVFEPVMTPYYLAPPLILVMVVAARTDSWRFWAAATLAAEVTIFAYHRLGPWQWWITVTIGLMATLALAVPSDGEPVTVPHRVPSLMDSNELDSGVEAPMSWRPVQPTGP